MKIINLLCGAIVAVCSLSCGGSSNIPAATKPHVILPPIIGLITTVKVQNLSVAQNNVPLSFGHIFAKGDVPDGRGVVAQLTNGSSLPLQVDIKATHDDGSLRHAVISATLPQLNANTTETISLVKNNSAASSIVGTTPNTLLTAGFTAEIKVTLAGQVYSVSADKLLKSGKYTNWLAGATVNEWQVSAPLKNSQGIEHPHLTARFAIRSYAGQNKARVDVTLENNWAYEPGPQNFTYDTQILVGNQTAYLKTGLIHYHHTRWRKVFWWGTEPQVHIQHNTAYLIASKAVPNYDQSIVFTAASIAPIKAKFTGAAIEPMGSGMAQPYMPTTGGRPDIGLMPGWAATYLLTMDKDAKEATLGTADLAGSWSMHYRDKNTDRPVSLIDYPYMTLKGNASDTYNPVTKKFESFPICGGSCTNPNTQDSAHHPAFSYLPYIVTGDYYHLEELQYLTMYNLFRSDPEYRRNIKGLFHQTEVRGQAWILRTLAEAAYITPDSSIFKKQFETFLANNLDYYNTTYTKNTTPENQLGIIAEYAFTEGELVGVAPWQDDFFTSAVGHTLELGYLPARELLSWKSKFPVLRMNGPDFCWIVAAAYNMKVRDTSKSPIYSNIGQVYRAMEPSSFTSLTCGGPEMATSLGLRTGEMLGYSESVMGYPSNMQPALAYSADSKIDGAIKAWGTFANRPIKPDYSVSPQFAIIPR